MPDYANPQRLNRYVYVLNNPLRYTDPTGHWVDEGCGCANEGKRKKTGIRVINGTRVGNSDGGGTFVPPQSPAIQTPPPTVKIPTTLALPLSGMSSTQDYYGDYDRNTNVPSFPGGNTQPNPFLGGSRAYALCLGSFIVSLVPPANRPNNTPNNFFLSFNVNYVEGNSAPASVSDLQWMNQYTGEAVFQYLSVNDNIVHRGNSYMLAADTQPIGGTYFNDGNGIRIRGIVETVINTPNGPGGWPYPLNYNVPDYVGFPLP